MAACRGVVLLLVVLSLSLLRLIAFWSFERPSLFIREVKSPITTWSVHERLPVKGKIAELRRKMRAQQELNAEAVSLSMSC
jgi:hypothetical protein